MKLKKIKVIASLFALASNVTLPSENISSALSGIIKDNTFPLIASGISTALLNIAKSKYISSYKTSGESVPPIPLTLLHYTEILSRGIFSGLGALTISNFLEDCSQAPLFNSNLNALKVIKALQTLSPGAVYPIFKAAGSTMSIQEAISTVTITNEIGQEIKENMYPMQILLKLINEVQAKGYQDITALQNALEEKIKDINNFSNYLYGNDDNDEDILDVVLKVRSYVNNLDLLSFFLNIKDRESADNLLSIQRRHMAILGKSSSGKSGIVYALSACLILLGYEIEITRIDSSDIVTKWQGGPEKNLRKRITEATSNKLKNKISITFFDEGFSTLHGTGVKSDMRSASLRNFENPPIGNYFFFVTGNEDIKNIDSALKTRFNFIHFEENTIPYALPFDIAYEFAKKSIPLEYIKNNIDESLCRDRQSTITTCLCILTKALQIDMNSNKKGMYSAITQILRQIPKEKDLQVEAHKSKGFFTKLKINVLSSKKEPQERIIDYPDYWYRLHATLLASPKIMGNFRDFRETLNTEKANVAKWRLAKEKPHGLGDGYKIDNSILSNYQDVLNDLHKGFLEDIRSNETTQTFVKIFSNIKSVVFELNERIKTEYNSKKIQEAEALIEKNVET